MLAVATDMQVPKDVNAISITISTNNQVKYNSIGRVTPEGEVLLPATLAIVQPDDPSASISIRVMAFKEQKAMVLRDVRTTIPRNGRTALLRVPMNFVNVGSVDGDLPANVLPAPNPTTSGTSLESIPIAPTTTNVRLADTPSGFAAGEFNPFVFVSNCSNPDFTWIDGECQDAYVDSNSLPDYDESLVFGPCFDVSQCFSNAAPIVGSTIGDAGAHLSGVTLDVDACTLAMSGDPATLNLAIVTPDIGACIHPGECYVPIDQGESGWNAQSSTVTLPPYVCRLLDKGYFLAGSLGGCTPKTDSMPVCRGVDANSSDGGADSSDSDSGTDASDSGVDSSTSFSFYVQRVVQANFPVAVTQGNGQVYFGSSDGIAYFGDNPNGPVGSTNVVPFEVPMPWRIAYTSTPSPMFGIVNGGDTAYLVQNGNAQQASMVMADGNAPSSIPDVTASNDGLYWLTNLGLYSSTTTDIPPQFIYESPFINTKSTGTILASPSSGSVVAGDDQSNLVLLQNLQAGADGIVALAGVQIPTPTQTLTFDAEGIGYALAQSGVYGFGIASFGALGVPNVVGDAVNAAVVAGADALTLLVPTDVDTFSDNDITYSHGLVTNAKCIFFTSHNSLAWVAEGAANGVANILYQPEDELLGLTLGTFQDHPAIYVAQYASDANAENGEAGTGGIYVVPIPPDCN
jgi:hypothetical protein